MNEHKRLEILKNELRAAIEINISQWENENGIWVTALKYRKSKRMKVLKIDMSLELPEGEFSIEP